MIFGPDKLMLLAFSVQQNLNIRLSSPQSSVVQPIPGGLYQDTQTSGVQDLRM